MRRRADGTLPARIVVEVSDDEYALWKKYIPWGLGNPIFRAVLHKVLEAIDKEGKEFCMSLIDGKFKIVRSEDGEA